jgi:hypothetical protein
MTVAINGHPYQAARELTLAVDVRLGPGRRATHFERAVSRGTFGTPEACEWVATVTAPDVAASDRLTPEFKRRFVEVGLDATARQAARDPREARPHYVAGLFLVNVGEPRQAIAHLERARALAPHLPVVLLALAEAQTQAGETARAQTTARHAFNLNTRIPESRLVYALTAVRAGDVDRAAALLGEEEPFRAQILLDPRLVQAYGAIDRPDDLAMLWTEHATAKPRFKEKLVAWLSALKEGAAYGEAQGPPAAHQR